MTLQQRVITVLDRMRKQVAEDASYAETYAAELDDVLEKLQSYDAFGTEGQCDPRGDMRNGSWSILHDIEADESESESETENFSMAWILAVKNVEFHGIDYNVTIDGNEGALMTVDGWLESVANGEFNDYDGDGRLVRNGHFIDGPPISPSGAADLDRRGATHVLWFNK